LGWTRTPCVRIPIRPDRKARDAWSKIQKIDKIDNGHRAAQFPALFPIISHFPEFNFFDFRDLVPIFRLSPIFGPLIGFMPWALAFFAVTFGWAYLVNAALYGVGSPYSPEAWGVALGMSAPIYIGTGVIALIVFAVTKRRSAAMWTWTAIIALTLMCLSIGAIYHATHPLSQKPAAARSETPMQGMEGFFDDWQKLQKP
jgi:hypothetical protein